MRAGLDALDYVASAKAFDVTGACVAPLALPLPAHDAADFLPCLNRCSPPDPLLPPTAAPLPCCCFSPAAGFQVESADDFLPTLEKALEMEGPVVVAVNVDYSQNRCGP